jgi:hypothetical protein
MENCILQILVYCLANFEGCISSIYAIQETLIRLPGCKSWERLIRHNMQIQGCTRQAFYRKVRLFVRYIFATRYGWFGSNPGFRFKGENENGSMRRACLARNGSIASLRRRAARARAEGDTLSKHSARTAYCLLLFIIRKCEQQDKRNPSTRQRPHHSEAAVQARRGE